MKINLYTKSVLTIIALSLATLALQDIVPEVNAEQQGIQKVAICDPISSRCARVGTASKEGSDPTEALVTLEYSR
ncbi:MAG: hypothetical protein ACE5NA_12915 [Nitrospiraceae bacterium]